MITRMKFKMSDLLRGMKIGIWVSKEKREHVYELASKVGLLLDEKNRSEYL